MNFNNASSQLQLQLQLQRCNVAATVGWSCSDELQHYIAAAAMNCGVNARGRQCYSHRHPIVPGSSKNISVMTWFSRENMSSRENQIIMNLKSREIMSSQDLNLTKSCFHEKIRSSQERNLAKSCHHEILDTLYNKLIPNDQSTSVAAAATAAAAVAECGRYRLDAGLPRHSSHCHIQTPVAIAACSCLMLRSQTTTTTLYNILERWYIYIYM